MTNEQIIQKWLEAEPYQNKNKSLKTDGQYLWSYELPVARYGWSDDEVIIYNYNKNLGGKHISTTTSQHISLILKTCKELGYNTLLVRPDYHG